MEYSIRKEEPKDIEQVRGILRSVFPTHAENKLVDALRENGKAILSRVAVDHEDVLGHILFSAVSTTPPEEGAAPDEAKGIGLAPVAVRPDSQSLGIGSALIQNGLDLCKGLGFDYCVVLGSPEYYGRFGFQKASRFGLSNEYGVDEEFMVIRFSDRPVSGLVRYAPEFDMFSV